MTGTEDARWTPAGHHGGLGLQDGRLVFANRGRPLPWQHVLVLTRDGAQLWRRGALADTAPWERHARAADAVSATTRWWVRVGWMDRFIYVPTAVAWGGYAQDRMERRLILTNRLDWDFLDPFVRDETLAALCEYLADVPAARPGLADPDRLRRLLEALGDQRWGPHRPKGEPMMGDEFDLYWAVGRALERHGPTRYRGRPTRDWNPAEHLDLIKALLPARLRGMDSRARLLEHAASWHATPWPFEMLLE